MNPLRILPLVCIFAICACSSSGQYRSQASSSARPSEPGKCYAKCLIPDQYEEQSVVLPIYTGTDANVPLEKHILVEGRKQSTWVKKKADRNCLSSNPDDCLVWCLEEKVVEEESIMYLSDTVGYKSFILKDFSSKQLLREGGFTEWREVVCENKINKNLVLKVQSRLEENGYSIGVIGPTGDFDFVTRKILSDYQRANGLPVGGLNIETLDALGVKK